MNAFKLLFISLFLIPSLSFANAPVMQKQAHWQADIAGFWLGNAGTNAYGAAISDGSNSQLLQANTSSTFGFRVAGTYTKQQNTWHFSYANFAPTWKTNSASNSDYTGNIYFSGKNTLQEIDIQHGYLYFINELLSINLHAGFSYLNLKSDSDFHGTYVGSGSQFNHGESQFSGSGPVVGLNLLRQIGQHFSFSNSANIGLYYGSFNASSNTINNNDTINTTSTDPKHGLLVPSINVNFTVGYHFQPQKSQIFHAQLGVQFAQFFNAVKTHSATSSQYSSAAFYGPFLRVGYIF